MKNYLIILLLSPLLFLQAQDKERKTTISFEYYTHDFGVIKEDGGTVSYDFMFTNAGNAPLIIKNVTASCGCTVPHWTKDPIAPGNQGKISVVFDPMNKPGTFNKTLTVFSNSHQDGTLLTLMGKVTPKPRKPHDDYPDKIGNLRMLSRYMSLGDITTEQWQRKHFEIFNHSDTVLNISRISCNTAYMNVKIEPMNLPPYTKGKITVEMSPKWRNDFGYVQDRLELSTNDKIEPIKNLFVTANIVQHFSDTSPEALAAAPKIKFDKLSHDFGQIKQGEKVSVVFTVRNEGQNELQIYKVKPSCGCTLTEWDKKNLKSGESAKLTLTFDSQGKDGVQEKHINIYCNDPKNHNPVLTLKAKIIK